MWIWLDKTGKVKQYLTHGPTPVVGETDFQIFAYFDGLDTDVFEAATIKFRKPDRQGNTYPVLFMRKRELTFAREPNDSQLTNFVENHSYKGFLFDFSDFVSSEDIVSLLDTPGLWQATITCLASPSKLKVSGLITFSVGASASDSEDEVNLTVDQALENLVLSAMLLRRDSNTYLRVATDFVSDATSGLLDPDIYSVGSTVFDLATSKIYRVLTITSDGVPGHTVSATYEEVTLDSNAVIERVGNIDTLPRPGQSNTIYLVGYGIYYVAYVWDPDSNGYKILGDQSRDGLGRVIHETYETKEEAAELLAEAKRYAEGHGDKSFVYHNDQGQDVWTIDHNLGKKPSVTIVADADEKEVIAEVEYVSENRLKVHFLSALNGSAYLN